MTLSLRWRIFLTLGPLLLLVVVLGGAGALLLHGLGDSIDDILQENYRSVIYMQSLNESLERIDSSFHIALAGREPDGRQQYAEHWQLFLENLDKERGNITLPGEADLVDELSGLAEKYRLRGDAFFARKETEGRNQIYLQTPGGLLDFFRRIKKVSNEILHINQENMEKASRDAGEAARLSLLGFAAGFALTVTVAGLLAWRTYQSIVQPMKAVTESALAISAGNLDQVVPVTSHDELGQVAEAFNLMARKLRDYRQSHSAQLLHMQRTTQATIDSFPDPVLVIDPEGNVELANPAARRLLGVVAGPLGQAAAGGWLPPEPLRQPLLDALRGQQDYLPEGFDKTIQLSSEGRERALLPRILTIRDPYGTVLGAAVLLQDVTRLRLLDEVKGDLVATASHELKTPLTSIRLAVHLLLEEAAGPLAGKQTELLLDARENCERLLAMVNNLLDLARLEQGSRAARDPARTAGSVAANGGRDDRSAPAGQGGGHRRGSAARDARGGRGRGPHRHGTAQPAGERAQLHRRGRPHHAGGGGQWGLVILSVADTGVGIAPEYVPHIFEKFFRIPGQSRGSGTGLGLAIVHEIVAAHGGTITCESQPGVGTTFRIALPITFGGPADGYVIGHAAPEQPAPK